MPISTKEMALKLTLGLDGLLERLGTLVPDVCGPVDIARKSL